MFRPPVRTLYLDFETHLYDLGGRNPETRPGDWRWGASWRTGTFFQKAVPDASLLAITITRLKYYVIFRGSMPAKFRLEAGEL
jgi:hypothetical protein